jgi:hypothetical protein
MTRMAAGSGELADQVERVKPTRSLYLPMTGYLSSQTVAKS